MSDETEVKLAGLAEDEQQWGRLEFQVALSRLEFQVALTNCEDRNEFVAAYLAALAVKLGKMKEGFAANPAALVGWQCAAFLVACGESNWPITDGVREMREFVRFLDDVLACWL